jgi:hypothetical protein
VPFAYYQRLTAAQKRIYRKSDALTSIELPGAAELRPLAGELQAALAADDRREVERICRGLADGICARLGAPPVAVRVLAARPSGDHGELHGLYDPAFTPPRLTIWMRTAAKRRIVAFRSFLRTLVHELLHHFDYELFGMEETFHTEGFFQRESSLTKQILGEPTSPPPARTARRSRVSSG